MRRNWGYTGISGAQDSLALSNIKPLIECELYRASSSWSISWRRKKRKSKVKNSALSRWSCWMRKDESSRFDRNIKIELEWRPGVHRASDSAGLGAGTLSFGFGGFVNANQPPYKLPLEPISRSRIRDQMHRWEFGFGTRSSESILMSR